MAVRPRPRRSFGDRHPSRASFPYFAPRCPRSPPRLLPLQLRVAQVTKAAASKLSKIKEVRKNIARVLTVLNQRAMDMYRNEARKEHLQRVPVYMRVKKTRAIRRALTPAQVRS